MTAMTVTGQDYAAGQSGVDRDLSTRLFDTGFTFSPVEVKTLRDLGKRVAELAERPDMAVKRKLWTDHNALRRTRPLLYIDPENSWNEILPASGLVSSDPIARYWEIRLRRYVYYAEKIRDDYVVEPYFDVCWDYSDSKWGIAPRRVGGLDGGAYRWEPAMLDYERDIDRIRTPVIDVDYERSERFMDLAKSVFDGILTVRRKTLWWWGVGLSAQLSDLRGFENYLTDFYDCPECVHRAMARLRDGMLSKLDFLEKNNLLALNTGSTYCGSGSLAWSDELPQKDSSPGHVRLIDMWGNAESQETVSASPAMFEEFVLQYQIPLMEKFGLNCYGCCESLDDRMHLVKRIPRLRRVSVCPWADVGIMADELKADYIYSWKPNPAQLAVPVTDIAASRRQLRRTLDAARGCHVEIIMKDVHSLANNPANLHNWCDMVKEEIGAE